MQKGAQIRRGMIAALAVAAVAGAAHLAGRPDGELQSAGPASSSALLPGAEPKSANLAELIAAPRPALPREARADLFAPPRPDSTPRKTAPAAMSGPAVPPFPYKYVGWVTIGSGAVRVHYLQKGNEVVELKRGEMLDGGWRIDGVSEDRIEVSFVPAGEQRSILFASLIEDTSAQSAQPASSASAAIAAGYAPAAELAKPAVVSTDMPSGTAAGLAQRNPRMGVASQPATMLSQAAAAGPGSSSAVPTGRLGVEAPASGSMPTGPTRPGGSMPIGPAPSGSMPTNPAPTGKRLGLE